MTCLLQERLRTPGLKVAGGVVLLRHEAVHPRTATLRARLRAAEAGS